MLFREGDDANSLFIILSGVVSVEKDGKIIAEMREGSTFGESSLKEKHAKRTASIIAQGEVICLSLSRQTIKETFGKDLKKLSVKNQQKNIINKSQV